MLAGFHSAFSLVLVVLAGVLAKTSDPAMDYCEGKGSICEIYDDTFQKCVAIIGKKSIKCVCSSGLIPMRDSCNYCKAAIDEHVPSTEYDYEGDCKQYDYKVSPIPSSIMSKLKDRNESLSISADATTLPFHVAKTTTEDAGTKATNTATLKGMADITLPSLMGPSPTSGSARVGTASGLSWVAAGMIISIVLW